MTVDSNTDTEFERIMGIVQHEKETGELPDWVTNSEDSHSTNTMGSDGEDRDINSADEPIPPAKNATGTNKCGKRHKGGPQRRAPVRSFH